MRWSRLYAALNPWAASAAARRDYEQQLARMREIHRARQEATHYRTNERVARYAAETRERIAAIRAEAAADADRRIAEAAHRARVAEAAKAAERERQRMDAYQAGLEQGRRDAETASAFLARELEDFDRAAPCTKIRLNDRDHALAMVEHVLETAGVRTEPYACPVCPRQLFGRGRFWHVRTVADPAEKARRDRLKRGAVGKEEADRQLRNRLDPDQVALLRARAIPGTQEAP